MDPHPQTTPVPSIAPGDPLPRPYRRRFGPAFWFQAVFGLAVAAYGLWMLYDRAWHSPTGFLIMCVGVMIAPLGITRLLGGLGAAGLGVWLIVYASYPFDYLYGALVVFVGGSSAIDGVRTFRGKSID